MKLKVAFIDLPSLSRGNRPERVFGCTHMLYPLPNIFSLSTIAVLEKNGFLVNYFDAANEEWNFKKFVKFISNDKSDVYCIHSINLTKKKDIELFGQIRNIRPDAYCIFSGPAPTLEPEYFLKDKKTFVVRGEPELTYLDLLESLSCGKEANGIQGVSFILNGNIVHNQTRPLIEDLDILPFCARQHLNNSLYFSPKLPQRPFTLLLTSRGCSHRCVFCVPDSFNFARELEYKKYANNAKPPVRFRSAKNVIDEFIFLKKSGYRSVAVVDSQFLWQPQRTIEICGGIKDLGIEWGCLARADRITEEIAVSMSEANCRYVDIGAESFDQRILDYTHKDLRVEDVYKAVKILKSHNILAKINLLIGAAPFETKEDVVRNIKEAEKIGADAVMFSLATPFPGTDFYLQAKENHWFSQGDYYPESVQLKAIVDYPKISHQELNQLLRMANLHFYFNPKFIMKNLWRLTKPVNVYHALIALKRKFF